MSTFKAVLAVALAGVPSFEHRASAFMSKSSRFSYHHHGFRRDVVYSTVAFASSRETAGGFDLRTERSDDDVLARVLATVGQEDDDDRFVDGDRSTSDQWFSDDVLEDMRLSLEILERRVRDGPGSLSSADVDELDARMSRIVADMFDERIDASTIAF